MFGKNSYLYKATLFDAIVFAYLSTLLLFGIFSPSEENLLDLKTNFQIEFALLLLGLFTSLTLAKFKIKTLGIAIFEPPHKKTQGLAVPFYKTFWGVVLLTAFSVTCYVGIRVTEFSFYELTNREGFGGAVRLIKGIFSPNFKVLPRAILEIIETVYIAFVATVLAVPLAFILSFFCAKNMMSGSVGTKFVYTLLRGFFNILRSVEPIIWAIIFSVWVGIGPFAGMLALMLHTVASLAKQYSEQIECIDDGPVEGIQATGASFIQVLWFAVVPQITLPYVAFTIFRWDINVRMATIIGLVGGGGIGDMLIQYQGQAMWEEVGCIALVIVSVVWIMDTASAYIRDAIK
ncbi:MAG: phosphonate ABC transporter, permease protein PhnE [Pseudomonadota bacterium]|nr:phosphonate ABC transporter, permease protein PhnE [Pseudomonadota bacterium]